jgi:hypothetical protein
MATGIHGMTVCRVEGGACLGGLSALTGLGGNSEIGSRYHARSVANLLVAFARRSFVHGGNRWSICT